MTKQIKSVLCLSGNDPTGGAGIQADIETLSRHGVHCLPMITLNTVQDSKGIKKIHKTPDHFLLEQFENLKNDIHIDAIKIGMLADIEQINCINNILASMNGTPVILDSIFSSGLGSEIKKADFIKAFCEKLLPLSFITTPNFPEAQKMFSAITANNNDETDFEKLSVAMLNQGAQHVLITGTHYKEQASRVTHQLFQFVEEKKLLEKTFTNPRLQHSYHGSGCTLSSAIAANLAKNQGTFDAVSNALNFTFHSLQNAYPLGKHQYFPNRQT